jgi:hypothetical protein
MEERRRMPRQRTFKTGSITLPHGIVECLIRNMSPDGALLEFLQPPLLPDEFALFIKPDMIERRSHIVWRNKLRIGVRFEYPASNPPSGHP